MSEARDAFCEILISIIEASIFYLKEANTSLLNLLLMSI